MENNKNIWLLPTNEPSRFSLNSSGKYHLTNQLYTNSPNFTNKNIYITSDEEIVLNGYHFNSKYGDEPQKTNQRDIDSRKYWEEEDYYISKIILTTDPKLIADGIQPIPDEFLEWFVKNPSCERVEVVNDEYVDLGKDEYLDLYKIIIPKVSKPTAMENKTPMQELIEIIKNHAETYKGKEELRVKKAYLDIVCAIEDFNLLEKEKQLIVNTFIDGEVNCGRQLAKDYYNEKINNNDNE
jgi:hypothetical protein